MTQHAWVLLLAFFVFPLKRKRLRRTTSPHLRGTNERREP